MIELKRITAYTVPEVAEMMKVVPATVYKYIKRGELKAKKIGNKFYVTDRTLEEFIAEKPDDATTASSVVSETETAGKG